MENRKSGKSEGECQAAKQQRKTRSSTMAYF